MTADPADTETIAPPEAGPVESPAPAAAPWARYAEIAVALAVVAMGIVILVETQDIRIPRALTVVGPRDFPRIVGAGLVILGIWYVIDVVRGDQAAPSADSEDADPTLPADWAVLGQLAIVLIAYAVLMRPAGFIIASVVLFFGASFALGSRHFLRDAIAGILISTVTFLVFSEWLGIRLPDGILGGLF